MDTKLPVHVGQLISMCEIKFTQVILMVGVRAANQSTAITNYRNASCLSNCWASSRK